MIKRRNIGFRQRFLQFILSRYANENKTDKIFKEFIIRKTICIKPLDVEFEHKFGCDTQVEIDRLMVLGFISITRYLNGNKTARITQQGRNMFYVVYL